MNYDLVIAGCGFAGSTIAYLAAQQGKRVLIYEKRGHIAGNMYDEVNGAGILVQKYGPHSFHTNRKEVYDFITSIGEWYEYILRARVLIDDKYTPSPFNFKTIDDYYDDKKAGILKKHLLEYYNNAEKVTIVEMLECSDSIIKEYAEFLFEKDYRPYTSKQWGINPKDLDISVLKRVPVRLTYVDRYFDDKWQVMPKGSFTEFFKKMLDSKNIDIKLNCDILEHLKLNGSNGSIFLDGEKLNVPLVYTGAVDELFNLKYKRLPYRSLYFDLKTLDIESYQETSGVAYPMAEGYTRITEYTKIPIQNVKGKTTIAVEYPVFYGSENGKEAYYPILTEDSQRIYKKYKEEVEKYSKLFLCGRLADFKYYNMDDVIIRAFDVFKNLFK